MRKKLLALVAMSALFVSMLGVGTAIAGPNGGKSNAGGNNGEAKTWYVYQGDSPWVTVTPRATAPNGQTKIDQCFKLVDKDTCVGGATYLRLDLGGGDGFHWYEA